MSRTGNAKLNIFSGLLQMVATTILSFISRKIFIMSLGANYLGLSGLFTNVLSVLSLAELGIGSAIVFSLYKPLADDDREKIQALMRLYKIAYRIIGAVILGLGLVLIPFLQYLVNFEQGVDINYYYIYLLFLINSVISYWFFAYRSSIISAAQKDYKIVKVNVICSSASTIMQIIILLLLKGNMAYYIYLLVPIVMGIVKNLIIYKKSNELFPFLNEKCTTRLDKKETDKIRKNIYALSVTKLSSIVYTSSDNLVISALIGTIYVGLYSNYTMITSVVTNIVNIIFNNLRNSVGDLNATESSEHKYEVYKRILLANMWIYGFCSVALFQLLNPFIGLVFGMEYIFPMKVTTMIALLFLIPGLNHTNTIYKDACGLFWQTRYRTLATAIVNIIVSIVLANAISLQEYKIVGVFLGTIIAYIITIFPIDPKIIFRDVFNKKVYYFYIWLIESIILTLGAMACTWALSSMVEQYTWSGFIIQCIIVVIIPNFIFTIFNFRKKEFKYYVEMVSLMIKNRK